MPAKRSIKRRVQSSKGRGRSAFWSKYGSLIIICSIVAVLGFETYRTIKREIVAPLVETFAEPFPQKLPSSSLTETQHASLKSKLERFADRIGGGQAADPVQLSADEINSLIEHDSDLRNQMAVLIYGDTLYLKVSIPMENWGFKNKYLNGHGAFSVALIEGGLDIRLLNLKVGERNLPEDMMRELRLENLAGEATEDPSVRRLISSLQDLSVRNGRLVLEPRIL
ncbi:MAG: hypothetical protein DCC75_02870 [Proteobacteria bacterium]|nr:MAG: hypothetical protein DCC75_02870 [Pseudomonadota bacterium]